MTAESSGSSRRHAPPPSTLARSLRLLAGAAVLLVISECIWLWQTWPVRELLQPVQPAPVTSSR